MRTFVSLVVLAALGLPAAAQTLPRIDAAKVCDHIARLGGTYAPSVYDECLVKEQRAYATLETLWPLIAAKVEARCQGETGSYDSLAACAKRQASALTKHLPFKF